MEHKTAPHFCGAFFISCTMYRRINRYSSELFTVFLLHQMKKINLALIAITILLAACKQKDDNNTGSQVEIEEISNYFPVTSYMKGQIRDIKDRHVNPLLYITKPGKTDSVWIQDSGIDSLFTDFLSPEIDTVNMKPFFKETKFLDETLGAFTFTYEPIQQLPDSISWQKWDVYVNPENGKVKRLFLVKAEGANTIKQLTWLGEEGKCKIVEINTSGSEAKTISEKSVKWKF